MADVAAKREARRRRILENSEYRLQRITGRVNHDESADERKKQTVEVQPPTSSSNPNGILPDDAIMENETLDTLINAINANIDADQHSKYTGENWEGLLDQVLSPQTIRHRTHPERAYVSNEYGNTESQNPNNSNNLRFPPDRQDSHADSLLENLERDILTRNSTMPRQMSLLISILSSRLIYVILAIVVNIMVILKLEHSFGTSIIVPFFAVMICRMCTCKYDDAAQGNNMLVAALILSNCRPDFVRFIQKLKDIFSLFGNISRDLAVYVFTFVLLYTVLSRYRNDAEVVLSLPNETEAIFTDNVAI